MLSDHALGTDVHAADVVNGDGCLTHEYFRHNQMPASVCGNRASGVLVKAEYVQSLISSWKIHQKRSIV